MKTFKLAKENNSISLTDEFAGVTVYSEWRAYTVAELPKNFGCLEYETDVEGISEWFNYKGLTYVRD
tara:strand:+ start:501 stop:701 length:201 start_codon:yes stop_codon:yes gene_type:complete